jgi:hypothetical protein
MRVIYSLDLLGTSSTSGQGTNVQGFAHPAVGAQEVAWQREKKRRRQ